jgi:hypothetical protein
LLVHIRDFFPRYAVFLEITILTEAEQTAVDKLPLSAQPWAHLLNFGIEKTHQITTPLVLLAMLTLGVIYVWPKVKEQGISQQALKTKIEELIQHQQDVASKAMPLLQEATEAVPLLRRISKQQEQNNLGAIPNSRED